MALEPYTRRYSLPSDWKSMTASSVMGILKSAPGWASKALMPMVRGHFQSQGQKQARMSGLMSQFQKAQEESRAANLARYQEAMGIYKGIEEMYAPGGAFGKGYEAMLERAKTKSVAGGMQRLVSAGLAGTTRVGGLERQFDEEVGAPQRARLEDIRMERLAGAKKGRAGFIERREDEYPNYALMAQLMRQMG